MAKGQLPTLAQLDIWVAQGKNKSVRDAIEAVPQEQWNAEIKLRLAQAYNNSADFGTPEGRRRLRRGLELLLSIEPEESALQDRFAYNYAVGFSWFFLDHPVEALPYFQKALKLNFFYPSTEIMVQLCQRAAKRPKARWPFREGVRKAWDAFEARQPAILKQLEAEKEGLCSKKLERMVSACLAFAFHKPECSVWKAEGKPILVCSFKDFSVKVLAALQFFRQAPAGIREVWDFQIGPLPDWNSPKAKAFLREYGDQPVQLFRVGGEFAAAKFLGFSLYDGISGHVLNVKTLIAYATLQKLIGLVPYMRLQEPVEKNGVPAQTVPLRELSQVLAANGVDSSEESAEKLAALCPYSTAGDSNGRIIWRSGKETGITRIADLANDRETRDVCFSDETVQDGIEGGYLVWPLPDGSKKKAREAAEQQTVEIQNLLLEQLGAAYIYPMGRATDNNFAYLDFIAWDLQPVLEAAAKLLEKAGLPWAVYRPYRDCDPATSLFGFDAPPLHKA